MPTTIVSKLIWAAAAAATAMAGAPAATSATNDQSATDVRPLQMHWSRNGNLVSIKIIGQSDEPVDLVYTLSVKGDSRSVNRGRARLTSKQAQVLTTINMTAKSDWSAELSVEGDHPYSQVAPN